MAFQVGALRPNDVDATIWVCGKVMSPVPPYERGRIRRVSVALGGDFIGDYEEFYPSDIPIGYLVPSRNFLLVKSVRYQYFGNPRGKLSLQLTWAERVVDSKGEFMSLQALDVFRLKEVDYLILGFTRTTEMSIVILKDPRTLDDEEPDEVLLQRIAITGVPFLASKFPVHVSAAKEMGSGYCNFEDLPRDVQKQLRAVYYRAANLAMKCCKDKSKPLQPYLEIYRAPLTPSANKKSQSISAHARLFGQPPLAQTGGTKKRKQDTKTPNKVKKSKAKELVPLIMSDESDSDRSDPLYQLQSTPPKTRSSTPVSPKVIQTVRTDTEQTNETQRLTRELEDLRERELASWKERVKQSNDQIESLRKQLFNMEKERDKMKELRDSAQGAKTGLELAVSESSDKLSRSQQKIREVENRLAALQAEYNGLEKRLTETSKLLDDIRAQRPNLQDFVAAMQDMLDYRVTRIISEDLSKIQKDVCWATNQIQARCFFTFSCSF